MEPAVRYCTTEEVIRIAYSTIGAEEFLPRGFDDAVRLFEVRWRPEVAAGDEDA
jgi:hypothetical protein